MLLTSGTFFLPHSPKKWEHWLGKRTVSGSEGFLNFWFMTPQRFTSYANGVTGNYLLIYWFTDVGNVIPNEQDHGLEQAESLSILLEDPKARRILDTFQALNVLRVLKDFTQSWESHGNQNHQSYCNWGFGNYLLICVVSVSAPFLSDCRIFVFNSDVKLVSFFFLML